MDVDNGQGSQSNSGHAGELASDQLHNLFYLFIALLKIFLL